MKRLTFIAAMLLGTAAYAQTTAAPDDIKTYINDQITDAVTQLNNSITGHKSEVQAQIEVLGKQVIELQKVIDEYTRLHDIETSRTFFKFDSTEVTEGSELIAEVAAFMKDYPSYVVTIEGHTDERGTREYNLYLGENRASFAKSELVKLGIDANRIQTVSYGKERPAVIGSNDVAWKQNRRGVFILNK